MRRWVLRSLAVAALLLVTESFAWLAHGVVEPAPYDRVAVRAARAAVSADPRSPATGAAITPSAQAQVLHPFLGYAVDPERAREPVSVQGFPLASASVDPQDERSGDVVVAILGGSVAKHFAVLGGAELVSLLEASPLLDGHRVRIQNLALPSFKQPQQLLALAYRFALGPPPDIVVNLDGFNDVVLGYVHNVPAQVYAFYPHDWAMRIRGATDPEQLLAIARLDRLRSDREALARRHDRAPLSWSVTADLVWARLDPLLAHRIAEAEQQLARLGTAAGQRSFRTHGPAIQFDDREVFLAAAVELWARSSLMMDGMSRRAGVRYHHFLQPNQYVAGTKPLSEDERTLAFDPAHSYAEQVRTVIHYSWRPGPSSPDPECTFTISRGSSMACRRLSTRTPVAT